VRFVITSVLLQKGMRKVRREGRRRARAKARRGAQTHSREKRTLSMVIAFVCAPVWQSVKKERGGSGKEARFAHESNALLKRKARVALVKRWRLDSDSVLPSDFDFGTFDLQDLRP